MERGRGTFPKRTWYLALQLPVQVPDVDRGGYDAISLMLELLPGFGQNSKQFTYSTQTTRTS